MTDYRLDPNNLPSIKSDLARLDRMTDEDIDYSDIPELTDEFFSQAKHPAYLVINPLPPSRVEWLRRQSLRVAAVFQGSQAMTTKCTWQGCTATTERRTPGGGWTHLADWGDGIKDGFYCPAHTAAIIDAEDDDDPPDPWLEAMLRDVYDRLGAMTKARGAGEFSAEESARYWALVCELEEIEAAIHEAKP